MGGPIPLPDMFMRAMLPDPPMPSAAPAPRRSDGRLDPVALAWYRYRIESGHYDATEVLHAIAEYIAQAQGVEDELPPR
jgi:hypothetical protein